MPYVIKYTSNWENKKTGKSGTMISYLNQVTKVGKFGSFIQLSGLDEAKKFDFITEARRVKRIYLRHRTGYEIVKLDITESIQK